MGSVKPAFLVWFLFIHSFEMVAHRILNWPAIYCSGPPGSAVTGVSRCPSPSLASAFKGLTCPWRNLGKSERRMQVMSVLGKPEGSSSTVFHWRFQHFVF